MKKLIVITIIFIIMLSFFLGSVDGNQFLKNYTTPSQNPVFQIPNFKIVSIPFTQQSQLDKLIEKNIDIMDVTNSDIIVYISDSELEWLYESGFEPKILFNDIQEMNRFMYTPEQMLAFHTYSQMTTELQDIANTYSSIAELYSLGSSVQGRTIWGLKITDNPGVEEDEPEVRICGAHHGNEFMSVELPLLLAWYLVDNYASDPDIQDLVDNRETWIIPMVNPDGREASSRRNANNVDLNRDYGYMWDGDGGSSSPFSQPETQVIRQHALENNFVLSLSYHTTAAYVNYLWNYKPQPSPDDSMIQQLSNHYASLSGYTAIRGYDWYQTRGDTNDFSYGCRGDIDWTIETANNDITYTWNKNRQAMLDIIDAADLGLRGLVKDAATGQPVDATVWVEEAYWPTFTDPPIGDYHHVLSPGSYTVHFQANGYTEEIETVTVTSDDEPTILNVELQQGNNYYAYQVTICKYYAPYGNFQNNPTDGIHALGIPDEYCASLGKGGYIVLDMGEGSEILNFEDQTDFKVIEGDSTDDGYQVYVSSEWDGPWVYVGSGMGTAEFDLDGLSIDLARYVKIIDDGDGDASEIKPCVDIDAIQNLAPPSSPNAPNITGPNIGNPEEEYEYTFVSTDPEDDDVYYYIDWDDGSAEEWIGPYSSGEEITAGHTWSENGTYAIRAKARDIHNTESDWSDPFIVTIFENDPPDTPIINGPTSGKPGVEYTYCITNTVDPEGDNVYVLWDWGDGNNSGWLGPYDSGEEICASYIWSEIGTFTIMAKLKDEWSAESDVGTLVVTIPKNRAATNTVFQWFLQQFSNFFPILRTLLQ